MGANDRGREVTVVREFACRRQLRHVFGSHRVVIVSIPGANRHTFGPEDELVLEAVQMKHGLLCPLSFVLWLLYDHCTNLWFQHPS